MTSPFALDRFILLDRLLALNEAEQEVLRARLGVPAHILPGSTAPRAQRAIALLEYFEQPGRTLQALHAALEPFSARHWDENLRGLHDTTVVCRALVREDPQATHHRLALLAALHELGVALAAQHRAEDACTASREAVEESERLASFEVNTTPEAARAWLQSFTAYAWDLLALERTAEALSYAQECEARWETLSAQVQAALRLLWQNHRSQRDGHRALPPARVLLVADVDVGEPLAELLGLPHGTGSQEGVRSLPWRSFPRRARLTASGGSPHRRRRGSQRVRALAREADVPGPSPRRPSRAPPLRL